MFTDDETRTIRRLYLWPKLGTYFLLSIFPALAVWVACIFVDNAILNAEGAYEPGLNLLLPIVMVYVVLCLVFSIGTRVIAGRPAWSSAQKKAFVEPADTSVPGELYLGVGLGAAGRATRALGGDQASGAGDALTAIGGALGFVGFWRYMRAFHEAARQAAEKGGVRLPRLAMWRAVVVLAPIVLIVAVFVPRFAATAQASAALRDAATDRVSAVAEALEDGGCAYVSADNPAEHYQSYGYSVYGYLRDLAEPMTSYVCVDTDTAGAVTELTYHANVDVSRTPEENLAATQTDFNQLAAMLAGFGLPAPALPAEFTDQFLAGSYYEELYVRESADGSEVSASFSTDPKDEFDENSEPYIYLTIELSD